MGRSLLLMVLALLLGACAAQPAARADTRQGSAGMIVVVLANPAGPDLPQAGSTPRGYAPAPDYTVSDAALDAAKNLAQKYHLREVDAWVIAPMKAYCVVFAVSDPAQRASVMAALAQEPLVQGVQPLQTFTTLGSTTYNDPYVDLQRGFAGIDAGDAQRATQGAGVRVAVIDTGMDTSHPDLQGRVQLQRNFVDHDAAQFGRDRHGTEVAGIIAANANNHEGIVGVAPQVRLLALKACWQTPDGAAAQCNSFTLAQALVAALDDGAQVINLSLGGPADPLLGQLLQKILARGVIVVGAMPPDGHLTGFPVGVPGVIAVAVAGQGGNTVLHAPGSDVITLTPGGHYDFASGSSLAAAHVSGAVALLLAINPSLSAGSASQLLLRSQRSVADAGNIIDVCQAVSALRHGVPCGEVSSSLAASATAH